MTRSALIACLLATLLLGGCDSEDTTRPPQISVSLANAAPSFGSLAFRRGTTRESAIGTLAYGQRVVQTFDSGTYTYTVESANPSTGAFDVEELTFTDEVEADQKHLYVFAQQNGAVVPLLFSRDIFSREDPNWELNIVHALGDEAAVDYYVQPPGTDLTTVTPHGTIQFGEINAGITLQPGSFEITITESGNAGNVLFASTAEDFGAGASIELAIAPNLFGTPDKLSLLGITQDLGFDLIDSTTLASARFINGGADSLARDIFLNGDFTTPFSDDVAFAVATGFVDLPAGTTQISVTPGDNPSVIETEITDGILSGAPHNILIAGAAGELSAISQIDNRIPFDSFSRLSVFNVVNVYEGIGVYLVPPGTDTSNLAPNTLLPSPAASERLDFSPGPYELTVVDGTDGNQLFGPLSVTLAAGGLYSILVFDSGDGTTVSTTLLDDFQ